MKDIKEKIEFIIEKSSDKPACKNCMSCKDGCCVFGCVNERNGAAYRFANKKMTTPDYSCDNFEAICSFNESTLDVLKDLLSDIERINEANKNIDLLMSNKITESDFIELTK